MKENLSLSFLFFLFFYYINTTIIHSFIHFTLAVIQIILIEIIHNISPHIRKFNNIVLKVNRKKTTWTCLLTTHHEPFKNIYKIKYVNPCERVHISTAYLFFAYIPSVAGGKIWFIYSTRAVVTMLKRSMSEWHHLSVASERWRVK